ncbi:glycosyltransferase family 4 protein [Aeromonas caviae]|uniref:glycosyltransferase family 4 protein n=1 Tax=Aeromonas caviae TaxID=648 RepID=UPI00301428E1
MNIAFVITSLSNKGPVIVIKDIISNLPKNWDVTIYYFDDINEVSFPSSVKLVKVRSFLSNFDLSSHDIVHSHLLRADIFCWYNKKNIKIHMSTIHADIATDLQISHGYFIGAIASLIWTYILKSAEHIVFLTNLQRDKYTKLKTNSVIHNGRPAFQGNVKPDEKIYKIKDEYSSYTMLGACANVVKRKGFDQVIDFLAREEGKYFIFVLVGDGPHLENIKKYAQDLGVYTRCFFVGKTTDVHTFLCMFDIFVMTSHSEGMPLALLEAASNKLPIVCSDLPVIKEIFYSDEVSFYNVGDINSLSNAIKIANANKTIFSSKVHNKFIQCYTDVVMSNRYQELYLKLKK